MDDTATGAPHVLIIGGYLTVPQFYWPMRSRLLARGAARVTIAPIRARDWLGAALVGFGPSLIRAARFIRAARRRSRQPLVLVCHSGGGVVARLAMSPVAFDGRRAAVADAVGCLVTLGTPHTLHQQVHWWEHQGLRATRFLERTTPGAWFAPTTAYLTACSTRVRPRQGPGRSLIDRLLRASFDHVVGPMVASGGDGIVSDEDARLEGARHLSFPDVLHGVFGSPWYGDEEIIDRWWPVALELWHGALDARAVAGPREPRPGQGRREPEAFQPEAFQPEAFQPGAVSA